jgi:hypothetical protein
MAASDPRQHAGLPVLPQRLVYGHMRASAADKDEVIGVLKDAFVEGRVTQDEQADRAGRALTARTYADLARLTEDLPVLPPGHPFPRLSPPVQPAARRTSPTDAAAVVLMLIAAIIPPFALLFGLTALGRAPGGRGMLMAIAVIMIGTLALCALAVVKGDL